MKKQVLFIGLCLFWAVGIAQSKNSDNATINNRELTINVFNVLLFQSADISYEKFLNDESSYGVTLLFDLRGDKRFDSDAPLYFETFALVPYYRIFFGKKPNAGFFAECFASYSKGSRDYYNYDYDLVYPCDGSKDCYTEYRDYTSIEKYHAFNLGFSMGGKWITSNDVVFSAYGGVGRAIASQKGPTAFPRIGVSLGKRF